MKRRKRKHAGEAAAAAAAESAAPEPDAGVMPARRGPPVMLIALGAGAAVAAIAVAAALLASSGAGPEEAPNLFPDLPLEIDDSRQNYTNPFSFFELYVEPNDLIGGQVARFDVEFREGFDSLYGQMKNQDNSTIAVYPSFTRSAYAQGGFNQYFAGICETCLQTEIIYDFEGDYNSADTAYRVLSLLGYDFITDIDIDKDPSILDQYGRVILLHSQYVTQNIFDAVTSHPNVVYLYPNSLESKIEADYLASQIRLVRGGGYPTEADTNGFDWEHDNSQFRADTECAGYDFYEIDNGAMLNCYPENRLVYNPYILKSLSESDSAFWRHVASFSGNISIADQDQIRLAVFNGAVEDFQSRVTNPQIGELAAAQNATADSDDVRQDPPSSGNASQAEQLGPAAPPG